MKYNRLFIILPLAFIVAVAISLVIMARSVTSYEGKLDRQNTAESLAGVMSIYTENLAQWVVDSTYWNESIIRSFLVLDAPWLEHNLGQETFETFNIASTTIINHAGQIVFTSSASDSYANIMESLNPPAASFIDKISHDDEDDPIAAAGYATINGTAHIVAVSYFLPDQPSDEVKEEDYGYFIIAKAIDQNFSDEIGELFGVQGLRFEKEATGPAQIRDISGQHLGAFVWDRETPGERAIKVIAPWTIAGVVGTLIGFLILIFIVLGKYEDLSKTLEQKVIHRTQELEKQRQRAEKASQEKSKFLARMSHELRTPLNAILGFGSLIKMDGANLPEQHAVGIGHIEDAGKHLLELVDEVLDIVEIDAGEMKVEIKPVAVQPTIDQCLQLVSALAKKHDVAITEAAATDLAVHADQQRLMQVLINILSNSIKYNRISGTVSINVSAPTPGFVRISVQDTGLGIAQEYHNAIFQPFSRAADTMSENEGKGIGLTISSKLVALMDGQIGFTSELGEGSLFWVELPAA